MAKFLIRLARLFCGLFLYALGIALTLNAQIGYAPWDVFHAGVANVAGLSIGTISILVGTLIMIFVLLLKETIGLGSLLNMIAVGAFLDLILESKILPVAPTLVMGLVMMTMGLFVIALGSFFYIGSAFGAGPRDSLMITLARRTRLPVGLCRGTIKLAALVCGWKLGGMVGLGTVLSAFLMGFCVQLTFSVLKFEVTRVQHESLTETFQTLFRSPGITR